MPARFDILLLAEQPTMNVSEGAAVALLRRLALAKQILPEAEAIAREWVEVYARSGPASHDIFSGDAPLSPVFERCTIRWGCQPRTLDWPDLDHPLHFFLLFHGCAFDNPNGQLRKLFQKCLSGPPQILLRPFSCLPPHAQVPEAEKPLPKVRKEKGPGLAGVRWEEF